MKNFIFFSLSLFLLIGVVTAKASPPDGLDKIEKAKATAQPDFGELPVAFEAQKAEFPVLN